MVKATQGMQRWANGLVLSSAKVLMFSGCMCTFWAAVTQVPLFSLGNMSWKVDCKGQYQGAEVGQVFATIQNLIVCKDQASRCETRTRITWASRLTVNWYSSAMSRRFMDARSNQSGIRKRQSVRRLVQKDLADMSSKTSQ